MEQISPRFYSLPSKYLKEFLKAPDSCFRWLADETDSGIFPAGNPPGRDSTRKKNFFPSDDLRCIQRLFDTLSPPILPPFIFHPSSSCISREPTPVQSRSLHASHLSCPVLSCSVLSFLPSFLPWRKIISREGNGGKPCRLTRGEGNSRDTASASVRFSRASGRETMPLKRRLCSTGKQRRNKNVLIHPPSVIPPSRDDLSLFFHFFLPLSFSLDLGFRDGCIKSRSKGHAFTVMQPFSFEHTRT